ncbi:MAG: carbohydrate ABC transporter permease [Thermoproteota archaeon]|nr:carbohydrate ABC transporter permease [Candidatus Brockarchaeota archaeon]
MITTRITYVAICIILAFFAFVYLLPFWTVLTTALKDDVSVILTNPIEPPPSPTLEPFVKAFNEIKRALYNSLMFTTFATIFSSIIGSLNGYILSKIRFKHSDIFFLLFSIGIFIPYQAVVIPLIVTMSRLGIYNTIPGMILTHTAYGIPICTLFFRNFYDDLPESLTMAAKIDGAGAWRIYRNIVLPLSWPAFVVTAVFQFTSIWNDFLFGVVLTAGLGQPASVVLANLLGTTTATWNIQMAGTFIYALPVVAVYLIMGKYLIKGYLSGAIKG